MFEEGSLVHVQYKNLDCTATVILDTGGPTVRVKSVSTSIEHDIPRGNLTAL